MNEVLSKQPQTKEDRFGHLNALDDELLKSGVILSEWCTFIIRDSDMAFGIAYLSCILTSVSGIETYLRSECGPCKDRPVDLINNSPIDQNLKDDIHRLRLYRNKWVHAGEPWDDELPSLSKLSRIWSRWFSSRSERLDKSQWTLNIATEPEHKYSSLQLYL